MKAEDRIMDEAYYMTRKEKWADFLNDPKLYFKRLHFGYYEERVMYNVRWILAKDKEDAAYYGETLSEYEKKVDEQQPE